jgi:hypothetical protein
VLCFSQNHGWIVVRNQSIASNSIAIAEAPVKSEQKRTDWGKVCSSSNFSLNEDDSDDLSDLMMLLEKRDHSLQSTPLAPLEPSSLQIEETTPNPPSLFHSSYGPIWLTEEYETHYRSEYSTQLTHEEELLRRYISDLTADTSTEAEEPNLVSLLQSQQQRVIHFFFSSIISFIDTTGS